MRRPQQNAFYKENPQRTSRETVTKAWLLRVKPSNRATEHASESKHGDTSSGTFHTEKGSAYCSVIHGNRKRQTIALRTPLETKFFLGRNHVGYLRLTTE